MAYTRKGPFPGPQYTDYVLFEAFDAGIYDAHQALVTPARAFIEKVEAGYADLSIVVTGDSTTVAGSPTFPGVMANAIAAQWSTHTVIFYTWSTGTVAYDAGTTIQTGSGSKTIRIYNSGVGSTAAQYSLAASRLEGMILTPNPDVIIVNHGHNHGTVYGGMWSQLVAFTETITQHLPDAQLFLVAQNPRTADNVSEVSTQVIYNLARLRGFGVIDAYSAFKANASWSTAYMADTIHPNTAGAAVIGAEAFKPFAVTSTNIEHPPSPSQQPSSFTLGGENLIYNGMFKNWTPGNNYAPVGWTRYLGSGGNSVVELGTTTELNTTPVRMRTTVSNSSVWMYQALDATQRARTAGRRVTLSFRCYLPSGSQTGSAALLPIFAWSSNSQSFQPSQAAASSTNTVFDRWFWVTLTYDVPVSVPSDLNVGLNAVNSSGIVDVIVDRCSMTFGALPVDWQPTRSEQQLAVYSKAATTTALNTVYEADDFVGGGTTSAVIGKFLWTYTGGTFNGQAGESGHPGIQRRDTGTTISTNAYTVAKQTNLLVASELFDTTLVVRLNTNDTDTLVRLGIATGASVNPPSDGMYVEKLAADTSWFGVTRVGNVQTRTSALGATSTGWVKFRVRRIDSSTVGFTMDSGAEVFATSNLATGAANLAIVINNATAVSKTIDVDFVDLRITGLVR